MKKVFVLTLVAALAGVLVIATASIAYAGGWWFEFGENESGGPSGGRITAPNDFPQGDYSATATGHVQQWGNPNTPAGGGTPSPHGGFSTSTNLCKTCHAVHLAASNSYRLLHNSSRMTECDWCHDAATGRSSHRPYGELFLQGLTVRGEHSLGATRVPDSDIHRGEYGAEPNDVELHEKGRLPNRSVGSRFDGGNGLYCFDCHSVHGANTLTVVWSAAIVREDPAANGGDANVGADTNGDGDYTDPGEAPNSDWTSGVAWGARTAFCADCHNLNSNIDTNAADDIDIAGGGYANPRPNPRSHVIGPGADGQMEAYHTQIQDSWSSKLESGRNPKSHGCRGCHSGEDHYHAYPSGDPRNGDWPHQTVGHKLLADAYTAAVPGGWGSPGGPHEADALGEQVGDPQRPLPEMDKICVDCHTDSGDPGTATAGVGITF